MSGVAVGLKKKLDGTEFNPGDRKLDVVTLASKDHEASAITPEKFQSFIDTYPDFFFKAEAGIRDATVTGVQTCALPISVHAGAQQEHGQQRGDQQPGA